MFVWTWDSYQTSQAGRDRMTRYWRNTMLMVALLGTVVAAVTLHGMHVDWISGTAWSAFLLGAVAAGLRPQDIGWPPRVRVQAAELIARGVSLLGIVGGVLIRGCVPAAVVLQSSVESAFDFACQIMGRVVRIIDTHIGVHHVALVARAVPAPRDCCALTAAA
jgi:hypothetical protein